jgi:hypothetical protein
MLIEKKKMENATYNRLVLIGNGFDRALNLKTGYYDFVLHLYKEAIVSTLTKSPFTSPLLSGRLMKSTIFPDAEIQTKDQLIKRINGTTSFEELHAVSNNLVDIKEQNRFLSHLKANTKEKRWVDIEYEYFLELLKWKTKFTSKKTNNSILANNLKQLKVLNDYMLHLTKELENYIDKEQNSFNPTLSNQMIPFLENIISPHHVPSNQMRYNRLGPPEKVMFLNFNYSNTLRKLINVSFDLNKANHIFIHGQVKNTNNPIVFGYGDDTTANYAEFEDLYEQEFLKLIKSFYYHRTNNYHQLLNFLEHNEFDVFIIGHSCGLSDRTLLNTIFEHKNCIGIKIFHYKGIEEYIEKSMEVSRHFTDKKLMRERIMPFDNNDSIPQL